METNAKRITPAWAGKSRPEKAPYPAGRDHPRVGGEKRLRAWPSALHTGSPPRGRGKGCAGFFILVGEGITPAWAGKSPLVTRLYALAEDHPRVGGEKHTAQQAIECDVGSPPRGRGKEKDCPHTVDFHGITPAWAGKRATPRKNGCPGGDHPRVGGEKPPSPGRRSLSMGSPPRGRGKAGLTVPCEGGARITPAWAGKRH